MALGAGNATPLQMMTAYAVFANGGYRVAPYFIERVEDAKGNVLMAAQPAAARSSAVRGRGRSPTRPSGRRREYARPPSSG